MNFDLPFNDFQKVVDKQFSEYKTKPFHVENGCNIKTKSLVLSNTQKLVSEYFTPENPNGFFVWASVGSGKSLLAVNLFKHFQEQGFSCIFITRTTLKKDIDKAINMLPLQDSIPRFSYKQLSNICKRKGANYLQLLNLARKKNKETKDPFYRCLVIIDEAHKLYTKDLKAQELHDINIIESMIFNSYSESKEDRARIVLMSATPITEDPMEFIKLFNLIIVKPKERFNIKKFEQDFLDEKGNFSKETSVVFQEKIKGLVSYLDLTNDFRYFAKVKYNEMLVPISKTPSVATDLNICKKLYTDCRIQGIDTVYCKQLESDCKIDIKNNRKFVQKAKDQTSILKERCGISI